MIYRILLTKENIENLQEKLTNRLNKQSHTYKHY